MEVKEFKLDPFQEEAISHLQNGFSVVVSAPTGSGKTAIAEFVINKAMEGKERVFYTTPLKALSNQKYHDFKKKYGEEKVGLLTGDSAVNRDAQIVVMTTEIYRNMLYGTVLGSVDENLKHLRYLVLDECHYMNDPDRGTVWEESIIYSPQNIQILALSATIANAHELCEWISKVHGEAKLIESFIRPVPLRFFYYRNHTLAPLLTTNNKLNPHLKEHKDSFNSGKLKFKDRERLEKKHLVKLSALIKELNGNGFLPAIYFVFSRRGCEQALKDCQELGFSLLSPEERKLLSKLVQEKTYGNDYLFKHKHLGFLYQGLAVHHAGLLPQWKEIVEDLFSKGLIKVVFATETLAAGINMPAKTTIISNLGKRGDVGFKNLTSNQFLQMSGRAGRRGMDKLGNVVIKETGEYTPQFAAGLATASPDPLVSQFTPNYSMALNLLQNHSLENIQTLLNKSFGQYLILRDLKSYESEKISVDKKLETLKNYPCPDPKNPGDIKVFRKQDEKINEYKRLVNVLKSQQNPEAEKYNLELEKFISENENYPCFNCKNQSYCFKAEKEFRKQDSKLKTINKIITNQGDFYFNQFLKIVEVLSRHNYLSKNIPTEKGLMAASLRGENIILISEVLLNTDFSKLTPEEFAGCVSALAIDDIRPRIYTKVRSGNKVDAVFVSMFKTTRNLIRSQRECGVEIKTNIVPNLCGLVEHWCLPETKWEELITLTNLDEGDIIRTVRRTMDLLRHIKNAPYLKKEISDLAKYAFDLADKVPVREEV